MKTQKLSRPMPIEKGAIAEFTDKGLVVFYVTPQPSAEFVSVWQEGKFNVTVIQEDGAIVLDVTIGPVVHQRLFPQIKSRPKAAVPHVVHQLLNTTD